VVMLADDVEFVIGVDTHKQTHTAAVVDRAPGPFDGPHPTSPMACRSRQAVDRAASNSAGASRMCPPSARMRRRSRRARTSPRAGVARLRSRTARRARCRPDQRGSDLRRVVTRWPRPQRRRVRGARRCRTHPRVVGPDRPPPTQPRRRPSTQPGTSHHRALTLALPRQDQDLRPTTPRRRQNHPRDPPLPQTTPRSPRLQTPRTQGLDSYGSFNL